MLFPALMWAQDEVVVLKGRVTSGREGVPYATVQLMGTSIGVSCNDNGEYTLKVPAGHDDDTIQVRSIGYRHASRSVRDLMQNGNIRLAVQTVELHEVEVRSYRDASQLIKEAVGRINSNYHSRTAYSTFFYRDWRSVDGELYLFDEAVMGIKRSGYWKYSTKRVYLFDQEEREMDNNYKTLLRHRLLVLDRALLDRHIDDPDGVNQVLEYADNESFVDPVATPQACYMLAKRFMRYHRFEPVREFRWGDDLYYLVRSVGPGRQPNAKVHFEYLVRKRDLAIVRITSSLEPISEFAPSSAWVNTYYNKLTYDSDTSCWTYDVREGQYTLTHYYRNRTHHLSSNGRGHNGQTQRWQLCIDWTLTDFQIDTLGVQRPFIEVKPQTLVGAFGESDYNVDYWHHYNSIAIDTLPLRLLQEKLTRYGKK